MARYSKDANGAFSGKVGGVIGSNWHSVVISGFTNNSYDYQANGNLKSDSQKNITLGYNFLNLPQTVSGSQNLNYTYSAAGYTYSAAGEKLKK